MFEATGVGVCLFTDAKTTNSELFEIDKEIKTFETKEELLHKLQNLESADIEKTAKAGQKRTLEDHSTAKMYVRIKAVFY